MKGEMKTTRPFLFSYHHDGAEWALELQAYDWQDAEARAKKLGGMLKLNGELIAKIPARIGFVANIVCWIRNFFK